MIHNHLFEVVYKSFIDILRLYNSRSLNLPFRKKVVVLNGDFKEILSIILKGTK